MPGLPSRLLILALVGASLVGAAAAPALAADVTVFAAASMKDALDAVDQAFTKQTRTSVAASYAASSALAKQIENGAPADVFLSADLDWMNELAGKGLIRDETRSNLLGNELVLVGPAGQPSTLTIGPGMPLAAALGDGRLALPLVDAVPAGKYGKAALIKLGVWSAVEPHVAQAENVRAALAFVARGEAPLGIVYSTDAVSEPKVHVVGIFPEDTHPPIIYPVALTQDAKGAKATAYLAFLKTPAAAAIFKGQGFTVLQP